MALNADYRGATGRRAGHSESQLEDARSPNNAQPVTGSVRPDFAVCRQRRPRPQPSPSSPAMDRLESLGNALSQITMYDIKSMYNQVRRTPVAARGMEHRIDRRLCRPRMSSSMSARWKRRSATPRTTNPGMSICRYVNGESAQLRRGASSTLMQEIAQGYVSCLLQ